MIATFSIWLLFVLGAVSDNNGDWPEFRGRDGQGHSPEQQLPINWSETENVKWKIPIPGLGWSSPVIGAGKIWLTSALEEGRSLRVLCLDQETGRILRDEELFRIENPNAIHPKNSHATPTPVLDEDRVYVHFGANGTACLSDDGRVLWKTKLKFNHGWGSGGSPLIFEDLVIVNCDGADVQYVAALDKHTGESRWNQNREGHLELTKGYNGSYSTPLLVRANGRDQLVTTGGASMMAQAPRTGETIWWVRHKGVSLVPRPIFGSGLLFVCTGYDPPNLLAIRPDGNGNVTDTHVAWSLNRGVPHTPSPLLVGEELYIVSDNGIAACLDAKSGNFHWRERLGGEFSASPLYADGRIYFLNEEGMTSVVAPGKVFRKLAQNQIEGRTLASLAISRGAVYLRSDRHLYRIENVPGAAGGGE